MHAKTVWGWSSIAAAVLALSACAPLQRQPAPSTAPAETPAPPPRVVVLPAPAPAPEPGDVAARRLLAYHEQIRQLSPPDLANEVNRLGAVVSATATAAPADAVLELALALAQQHNPGDLARAVALLEPITKSSAPELAPWQPLARLLLGRVTEQRRLEDQLAREVAQRREQQRTLQQLNEKLEALKAIERSMTARPPVVAPAPAGAPPASSPLPPTPSTPRSP
ncbi:MAG: hypothetical protein KF891_09540 [Rhizobacter sp.]|nr:hypothetical protein [Rhizobacter sp.]